MRQCKPSIFIYSNTVLFSHNDALQTKIDTRQYVWAQLRTVRIYKMSHSSFPSYTYINKKKILFYTSLQYGLSYPFQKTLKINLYVNCANMSTIVQFIYIKATSSACCGPSSVPSFHNYSEGLTHTSRKAAASTTYITIKCGNHLSKALQQRLIQGFPNLALKTHCSFPTILAHCRLP